MDMEQDWNKGYREGWNDGAEWAYRWATDIIVDFDEGAVWVREALLKRLRDEWASNGKEGDADPLRRSA